MSSQTYTLGFGSTQRRSAITVGQAARLLGQDRDSVYRRVRAGQFHGLKFKQQWFIPATEVTASMAAIPA